MKFFRLLFFSALFVLLLSGPALEAQAIRDAAGEAPGSAAVPLRRIVIYSSGVAYFEHSGTLSGPARLRLPFKFNTVNDALKSLVLNDPASASPLISYPLEQNLWEALQSLGIDLSGDPGITEILSQLRGEEVEVSAAGSIADRITGRITALDYRLREGGTTAEPWLSLSTSGGIRLVNLKEISALRFTDPRIGADLDRALDLLTGSRNSLYRDLTVSLSGEGSRPVSLSYVIPAPVWKVSYRLDLSAGTAVAGKAGEALLQGWAIVDNDGGTDWQDVELTLAAGRPVSFIQDLYPPYYAPRPTLPLAIAGAAEAETWESSDYIGGEEVYEAAARARASGNSVEAKSMTDAYREAPRPAPSVAGGTVDTARAASLGDQFAFTVKGPVSLNRRQSAMLPLAEGKIAAARLLILPGGRALGRTIHPYLGAELGNSTGMGLPAGPLTVYDGGAYAGDALIEFFNAGEKRLISWGEDLSVTASAVETGSRFVSAVSISGGLMTISRRQVFAKTYTVKNTAGDAKRVLIEHPLTPGAELAEPAGPDEKTPSAYRFVRPLPAGGELVFTVREERPIIERIALVQQRPETLLGYASGQEIPPNVRAVLQKALELKGEADAAQSAFAATGSRREFLVSEQGRIRQNLEAAGNQSPQGQEYLRRLTALDGELDKLARDLEEAEQRAQKTQKAYEDYLGTLKI
ncbi:MAG: DUF4139 domain-containing protein [Treponema sp.]|jgi:hypothetical protein|nr:DUF4139 domain-containing protein [Treponema sp.]